MDTTDVQFVLQDFYYKFEEITENGDSIWKRINLDKRRIIWLNPNNGFAIAALKDLEFEIKLPNAFSSFDENLEVFKSLWMKLEYDLNLLYENIKSHHRNNEYCCLDCNFPFATVCSELFTQFDPDDPPLH